MSEGDFYISRMGVKKMGEKLVESNVITNFMVPSELAKYRGVKLALGGVMQQSSIRIELPSFLHDNYNQKETYYQEHVRYTGNPSKIKASDFNKEKERLEYFNVSQFTKPQWIKKKHATSIHIDIHFFLDDGSRPKQKDSGLLSDVGSSASKFATIRNLQFKIYTPVIATIWFNKIQKNTFFSDEIKRIQTTNSKKAGGTIATKMQVYNATDFLTNLFNTYSSMRRMTSVYGTPSLIEIEPEIKEKLNKNDAFYKELFNAWKNTHDGNYDGSCYEKKAVFPFP